MSHFKDKNTFLSLKFYFFFFPVQNWKNFMSVLHPVAAYSNERTKEEMKNIKMSETPFCKFFSRLDRLIVSVCMGGGRNRIQTAEFNALCCQFQFSTFLAATAAARVWCVAVEQCPTHRQTDSLSLSFFLSFWFRKSLRKFCQPSRQHSSFFPFEPIHFNSAAAAACQRILISTNPSFCLQVIPLYVYTHNYPPLLETVFAKKERKNENISWELCSTPCHGSLRIVFQFKRTLN